MSKLKLFGNKIQPACKYCEHALKVMSYNGSVLCPRVGVVQPNYRCRHYIYDPIKRVPRRPLPLQEFDPMDFSLD